MELQKLLQQRPPITIENTKYPGYPREYRASITLRISSDKNYEIYCRYHPTLVWKKLGPMRWRLVKSLSKDSRVRYLDSGIYDTSRLGRLIWDNDTSVDWQDKTYIESISCIDTLEGLYAVRRGDYWRIRTTVKNVTKEIIQTREEHYEASKALKWM